MSVASPVVTASWYHCSIKIISRSGGRTAVASAAYRAGARLHDDQLDKTYDYTRRHGIETSFIVAPDNAPEWAYNLERLWNEAQARDNRKNSCLARECELALPSSLDATDREAIARDFARHLVERYGVAVSVALHDPSRHGDDRNYHAHIMFSTRRVNENGFGEKTRELDDRIRTGPQEVIHIREYAATLINRYLEDAGIDEKVDHRSYEDRGIDQKPTKHLGPDACAIERRGEESRLGNENRAIAERNRQMDMLVNELVVIDAEIAAEMEKSFFPGEEDQEQWITITPIDQPKQEDQATAIQTGHAELPAQSWEEQKAAAKSAFFGSTSEKQEHQAVQPALIWEEQKMAAKSAFFHSIDQEPQHPAEQSVLSWKELKAAAKSAFFYSRGEKQPEIQPEQADQSGQSWEEQKKAAKNPFNSVLAAAWENSIETTGQIREHGLGTYHRSVALFENMYYGTMQRIRETWQKYVGRSLSSPAQDRQIEPEEPER